MIHRVRLPISSHPKSTPWLSGARQLTFHQPEGKEPKKFIHRLDINHRDPGFFKLNTQKFLAG
jgi:hypothetical protein